MLVTDVLSQFPFTEVLQGTPLRGKVLSAKSKGDQVFKVCLGRDGSQNLKKIKALCDFTFLATMGGQRVRASTGNRRGQNERHVLMAAFL